MKGALTAMLALLLLLAVAFSPASAASGSSADADDLAEQRIMQAVQRRNAEIIAERSALQSGAVADEEPAAMLEAATAVSDEQAEKDIYAAVAKRNTEIAAAAAAAPSARDANVLEAEVFGSRVFVEQTSAEGGAVEAEAVEALTADGSPMVPMEQAEEGASTDASLLQHSTSSSVSAALGVDAKWAEPTYLPERAEPEAAAATEPAFIHPLPVPRAVPVAAPRFMQLGMDAAASASASADSSMRAQELEEATAALKAAQELAESQAKELAAIKAAQAASSKLRSQAEAGAQKLVQFRGGDDTDDNIVPPAPVVEPVEFQDVEEEEEDAAPAAPEVPAGGQLYVDAPGPFASTVFSDDNPLHARAQRLLNKQYTAPAFYPKAPAAAAAPAAGAAAPTGPTFRCRSAASHPIQAPVYTASFAATPAYSCKVSPFLSGLAWQTCHQQHQSCYLSCQSTQEMCDKDFENCVLKSCGTGAPSPLCKAPAAGAPAATDPAQTEQNRKVCSEHLVPMLRARFFNTTSYARCQSHACMCVSTPEAERAQEGGMGAVVLPPSALESWPFYTIESESPESAAAAAVEFDPMDTSFLEQGATVLPSKAASLFEQLDARDFVPELGALSAAAGTELLESVADRPDVLAMSSAKQVIGVDYSAAEDSAKGSPHVRAGLVVAKGRRTLEHHIPTCARLAGGRLLGVFESRVGGDASVGLPAHRLLMGVTQQGQARGLVMSSSLLVQLFADRVEVSNAWTPSLQRINSAALAVVTIQVWASVWEQELFYSLLLATLERVNEAELPVIFRTLEPAAPQVQPMSDMPALLEAGRENGAHDADPYVSAAESLLHAHATRSTGFWIESVSFRFPSSVLLVLKSASPMTQRLRLEARSWSEAHAHRNASTMLEIDMSRFALSAPGAAALAHPSELADTAGEESFLGAMRIHTQHVEIEMQDTIDSVFILTDRAPLQQHSGSPDEKLSSAERDAVLASADQVFTNLGYFFFFAAGTTPHAHAASVHASSGWVAGLPEATPTGASVVPELVKPPVLDNGLALPVSATASAPARMVDGPRDPASMSHIVLPGSGVLSVAREPAGAHGLVGVARSLTPLSTGVDLSHGYWGVSVLLRLLPTVGTAPGARTTPLVVQLQLESPAVHDYAFHRSPLVHLSTADCWTHVQFPFAHFKSLSGRPLDLDAISKLTLLAQVGGGAEGEVSRLEVASFIIQTAPLDNQERVAAAPCSHACNAPGAGPMPIDGAHKAHQRARIILTGEGLAPAGLQQMRSHMQARAASLVEMQTEPQRAAASVSASLSPAAVVLAALVAAWRML